MRRTGIVLLVLAPLACGRIGYDSVGTGALITGGLGGSNGSDAQGTGGGLPDDASANAGAGGAAGDAGGGSGGSAGDDGAAGSAGSAGDDGAAGSGGGAGVDGAAGAGGSSGTGGLLGSDGASGPDGVAGGDAGNASDGGGTIVDGGTVPCAMQSFSGHTYAFCDGLVDWSTARAECALRGMRLVRIDDAAENSWLVTNSVFSSQTFQREALWIGGCEPTTDGDWHWTDGEAFWLGGSAGTAVNGLYTNWLRGEPDNSAGAEACVAIPLNKGTWSDWQCGAAAYFACELY